MRRLLAFLIALVVPLQISFAAASEYCEVGKADRGHHYGHHAHAADLGKDSGSPAKKAAHTHCGFCHLGCTQAQPSSFVSLVIPSHAAPVVHAAPVLDSQPPRSIERPPKNALA